jgi:predicted transcriptional regulator YdeE
MHEDTHATSSFPHQVATLFALAGYVIAATAVLASQGAHPERHAMKPRVVDQSGFTVVGISARTRNTLEATANGAIPRQWDRFMKEGLLAKIPNKIDSAIVAVYTDYASDKDGEYTYLVGTRVSSDREVPAGMVAKKIPAGRYAVFTSERGPAGKVVSETWKQIWSVPRLAPGGDRAYKADFEVYDERAVNPQNMQVDVYVGIK